MIHWNRRPGLTGIIVALALVAGCSSEPLPVVQNAQPPKVEPKPDPSVRWNEPLESAAGHLSAGRLAETAKLLSQMDAARDELTEQQAAKLADLESLHRAEHIRLANAERASTLADGLRSLQEGNLDEARRLLDEVLDNGPTSQERAVASAAKNKIEELYRARRKLQTAMRLLASSNRGEVRDAKEQLWGDMEAAFPLLVEAAASDNPVLAANTLELLRTLNQPTRTLPVMLGVLSRTQQSASWPAAIRELSRVNHPGAGEPLLQLSLKGESPEQRIAALMALSGVVDPPPRTLLDLLGAIHGDGAELPTALLAAAHAVRIHGQTDVAARRGIEFSLTADEEQQSARLGERLGTLAGLDAGGSAGSAAAGTSQGASAATAQAAILLAMAARLIAPQALSGVKVERASAEETASPAANVLDGVWNAPTVDKLWRYPLGGQAATIVFDLGAERTVAGVRIWNYNEQGAHRGWKEVEVFVSNSPALLSPIASGLVPPAPGAAASHDYSVALSVPPTKGRYVKLQPRSMWRDDAVSGLSEVHILGF